jgi:hypothetical protein
MMEERRGDNEVVDEFKSTIFRLWSCGGLFACGGPCASSRPTLNSLQVLSCFTPSRLFSKSFPLTVIS